MKKVVILGRGKSGLAAYDYLLSQGVEALCIEKDMPLDLTGVDCVVKSPGIPMRHPWVVETQKANVRLIGEIDLAMESLQSKRLIGVTGSNGKTTTVMALTHVLGEGAIAVGNIGIPLLSVVNSPATTLVIELSSFQLETIEPGPFFDAALLLNITPNHLDHHPSMEQYVAAKWRIKECLKPDGVFFTREDFLPLKEKVETILASRYTGEQLWEHDGENFAAVYAVCQTLGVTEDQFVERMQSFQKPPHRIEYVATIDDVAYINDSKATSIDAVSKAVNAIPKHVHLIAGGVDKGGSFCDWLPMFEGKVKQVFAIGEAAERIERELAPKIPVKRLASLEEAVLQAAKQAEKGECVLLSPGCSSYDQFQNFQQRGETFKQVVHALGSKI